MTEIIQFRVKLHSDEERLAFVDGHLDPVRSSLIEAALPRFPAEARRIAAYRAQNEGLRHLFSAAQSPVPPELAALEDRLRRRLIWLQRRAALREFMHQLGAAMTALLAMVGGRAPAPPVNQASASSAQG